MYVLGLSCYYHDAAACLLDDEKLVAAAAEERFSREKHDSDFPSAAVEYCLEEAGITVSDLEYVGFYEKPIEKFDRILETFVSIAPLGFRLYMDGMPLWIRNRLWIHGRIKDELGYEGEVLFTRHHQSHAASTFYASPYEEAAILTIDGVGEWNTTAWGIGEGNELAIKRTLDFPHSLGLLYSVFTSYLGFKVNNGEYKVMGLASYGDPEYADVICQEFIDIKPDGSFRLNLDYFDYLRSSRMYNRQFVEVLGHEPREPDGELKDHHFDIAASIQTVTEEVILSLVDAVYEQTEKDHLCMAGGVALNSVANGRVLRESQFRDVYVQPAAGDDGGAYGVAAAIYHQALDNKRTVPENRRARMNGTYLGPESSAEDIRRAVEEAPVTVEKIDTRDELLEETAARLERQDVVGLFQRRMEWGPRALGNRSILANPRKGEMQDIVNRKIKFREGFRPFAPTVLADRAQSYFDIDRESPFMLFVCNVHEDKQEEIPAVTHADGTSRIQTIQREDNRFYYDLIESFAERTGTPVLLNTSFNRRGEPIVRTAANAVDCFLHTDMDSVCFPACNILVSDDDS